MAKRKKFDSDGESMEDAMPLRRTRKKPNATPPPKGRNKAPRRSGRVKRPSSPMPGTTEEDGNKAMDDTRVHQTIEISPSPEPTSSPEMMPHSPLNFTNRDSGPDNSVQEAFDSLEQDLRAEQELSRRQLQEIEDLKQQLRERDNTQNGKRLEAPKSRMKRDKVIEAKDNEIGELQKVLKATRDIRTASRLALDTRDKELEKLRRKHKALIEVADMVAKKWSGMGELSDAVADATE